MTPTTRKPPPKGCLPPSFGSGVGLDILGLPRAHRAVSGMTAIKSGTQCLHDWLGHPCTDPMCRYRTTSLTTHPTRDDVRQSFRRGFSERWPRLDLESSIREMNVALASVSSQLLDWVDLRTRPEFGLVNAHNLRLETNALYQLSWAMVRAIRDEHPQADGIILNNGGDWRVPREDYLIFHQSARSIRISVFGEL